MGKKIYLLNFWIKLLFLVILFLVVVFISLKDNDLESNAVVVNDNQMTTAPDYSSINVLYKDSVYQILDVESYIEYVLYKNGLTNIDKLKYSFCDTILIDSAIYEQFRHSMLVPQPRIDSIYKQNGKEYLVNMYFEKNNPRVLKMYKGDNDLSSEDILESRYVINILVREGFIIYQDCETGYPILSHER